MIDSVKEAEKVFGVKATPLETLDKKVLDYMTKKGLVLLLLKK